MTNASFESLDDFFLSPVQQQMLRQLIEQGLPLTPSPYLDLAEQIGASEPQVIAMIQQWLDQKFIKRYGLVVKHHALGYRSNGMVVWNVPDEKVDQIGESLSKEDVVTLCYQRPRILPQWPYNLFTMIHGKNRDEVKAQIDQLVEKFQLESHERDVLFSYKSFKQCGGRYVKPCLQ